MSADGHTSIRVAPVTDVVGDAVGVGESHWFVAVVNHNSEKVSSRKLDEMGITNYLPTQQEIRVWRNGRKSKVDRIVIPSTIFIYCTEQKRREIVGLPFIFRFMTNKAGSIKGSSLKPLAVIPETEINRLRFMLGQSDTPVNLTSRSLVKGDRVRVSRGSLMGLEGMVVDMSSSKTELTVDMGLLGCAKLVIDSVNLELADRKG